MRLVIMFLLVVAVSACTTRSGDADVPKAAGTGCPALQGSYSLHATGGSGLDLAHHLAPPSEGRDWQALTVEAELAGSPIHFRLRRSEAAMTQRVADFRREHPEAWSAWVIRAERDPRLLESPRRHAEQLARLGPSPEFVTTLSYGRCDGGWLRFSNTERDLAEAWSNADRRSQSLSFAVDAEGALLVHEQRTSQREFPIWCGDGCKGIPYAFEVRNEWSRLPKIDPPAAWRFTRSMVPGDADPAAPPATSPSGQKDNDPRVTHLRQKVFAALPPEATMFNFYESSGTIVFSGTCRNTDDLDTLVRFIEGDSAVSRLTRGRQYENNRGHIEFRVEIELALH